MQRFKWTFILILFLCAPLPAAERVAKGVILFLGDAGGIPTLHAASVLEYRRPGQLFIQQMPHLGLSETSSASDWVADSAAGMTAIVTGKKTHNGVISQSDAAVRGKTDGEALKTILEYAEERGLSTGVVSNSGIASATPAALYAHANDRKKIGEIFAQVLKPRFGDGVDVVIGPGRAEILKGTSELGLDLAAELPKKGYRLLDSMGAIPSDARRVIVLLPKDEIDLEAATRQAISILSRNPKGFFLMVESDLHTNQVQRGLERTVAFDRIIKQTVERMKGDTLVLFTADHSFDLRIVASLRKSDSLLANADKPAEATRGLVVKGHHAAEEVLVAAEGPGAERVHGFLSNTELFRIMMAAYGWKLP